MTVNKYSSAKQKPDSKFTVNLLALNKTSYHSVSQNQHMISNVDCLKFIYQTDSNIDQCHPA